MTRNDDSSWPLFLAISFWGASVGVLLAGAQMAWILKDGLGPNAAQSHGLLALSRFWTEIRWTFGLVVVPLHLAGWFCCWLDRQRTGDFSPRWIERGALGTPSALAGHADDDFYPQTRAFDDWPANP
jgi:hypothetical protein